MTVLRIVGSIVGATIAVAFCTNVSLAAERIVTYSVAERGPVKGDFPTFVDAAAQVYVDLRGWSLGGAIEFRRVPEGGDFVLWLASPEAMQSFSDDCSPLWSCRVGRAVVINDLRFRAGSPFWSGPLDEYRLQLINHETGHWIGLDHETCGSSGELAPVMMQQSEGVADCMRNPWPLDEERALAAHILGVTAPPALATDFNPPRTRGFVPVP